MQLNKKLLLFFFFSITSYCFSKNKTNDSLLTILKSGATEVEKVSALLKLIEASSNSDTALMYANKALVLANLVKYTTGIAESNKKLGKCYMQSGNNDMAIESFLNAIDFYQQLNDKTGIGKCNYNIGLIYYKIADYTKSLNYLLKAMEMFEQIGDKYLISLCSGNLGNIYYLQKNYDESLKYHFKSLHISEELRDENGLAKNNNNIGLVYIDKKNYTEALEYENKAISIYERINDSTGLSSCYINIAIIYDYLSNYKNALDYYIKALQIKKQIGDKAGIGVCYVNMGDLYIKLLNYKDAIAYSLKGIEIATEINDLDNLRTGYRNIASAYEGLKDYKNAYEYESKFKSLTDSIFNEQNSKNINDLKSNFLLQKKDIEQKGKDAVAEQEIKRQKTLLYASLGGVALLILLVFFVFRNLNIQKKTTKVIVAEKQKSENLLLNILPAEIAHQLKETGATEAKLYANVSVLFTDFVGFTTISENLTPKELVAEIHLCFTAFDEIMGRNGLEKIKTIGDAYLAVCGLPNEDKNHAKKTVQAAIEIKDFINKRMAEGGKFNIRIGINSGPVVAGIVGVKKFAYDIWGDTVNTAARMEQSSTQGKINISESTYQLVKNDYNCIHRGKIQAKNKGEIDMYFVE